MTIPYNKNITKQLNSYSYVISIILQGLFSIPNKPLVRGIKGNSSSQLQPTRTRMNTRAKMDS